MNGFVKYNRSEQSKRLHSRPNENHVLSVIAYRTSREGNPVKGVQVGECIISDYDNFGLKRQPMRTAITNLRKWGYITTRATNKTTYAKLVNTEVYDCNLIATNQQNNQQLTSKNTNEQPPNQPTANHYQEVKNKEVKNKEVLPYEKEFFTICEQFKKITGKTIRVQDTPAKIKRSDKYKIIAARLNAGASVEEMIKVIELKFNDWKDNSQMQEYIRLSTFFALKNYESYLDELDNQRTQPQPEQLATISITDHYKKYYPTKWKFLANSGKLKEYEAKFVDLNFKYSNIAKSHQNPTITAAFIFEAVQTNLNRHLSGSNEQRRIDSLTKWIERDLSDYKRNKADVRNEFFYWTQSKDK